MKFEVWAPKPETVELLLAPDRRLSMEKADGGWWRAEVLAEAGTRYGFCLDGGKPLPDPRSMSQPDGPHGLSAVVDHAAFRWRHARWQGPPLKSAVIYELHVGTFTPAGTFEAAMEPLGYLTDLGVTHIELMPVAEFPGDRGWGYDGVDLFAPHHVYGGPEGLKRLVDAAHGADLGVILDVVYNHFGPCGNYLGEFGPYLTDRYRTNWGSAVNFDGPGSDEVRRFVLDNARMWLRDYHADGLRLDGVHAIFDHSAVHILEELAEAVSRLAAVTGRHAFIIGESDLNDPRILLPPQAGGYGLDAQWSDDFHHVLHTAVTGESDGYYADFAGLRDLPKALRQAFVYDGRHSICRGRRHGRQPVGLDAGRFLAYIQNHDQIGNRAAGERIGHLVSPGRAAAAAALVLCGPFVPMLFAGEEFAATTPFQYFTSFPDAELGRAVSEGRRREFSAFGWEPAAVPDPQDPATFQRSKLAWEDLARPECDAMLAWYRSLIALRRTRPELAPGPMEVAAIDCDPQAGWLVLYRGRIAVAINLGRQQEVPLRPGPWAPLLTWPPGLTASQASATMPPDSALVAETKKS